MNKELKSDIISFIVAMILWVPGSLLLFKIDVEGYVYMLYLILCIILMQLSGIISMRHLK